MKILITGAGGFVGRHVSRMLVQDGHDCTGIDAIACDSKDGVTMVVGDLADERIRARALNEGCDAIVHLATVPGGAAEADPAASRRINVDAMYDLMVEASVLRPGLRFIYASSIAVFGDPLPAHVDDATPLSPKMIYGGHKAMMEDAVALLSNRGAIDGVTVRLPGILARPKGPSGLKSAFMSDLFHALRAGEPFICPVSADGTIWAQSLDQVASNFLHALSLDVNLLPPTRAVTLPALRLTMGELAAEIARQCGVSRELVRYEPDLALEAAFATQPPLLTSAAQKAGFAHDGDVATLVANGLRTLS